MKILVTGGHLSPALAIIDRLQKNKDKKIEIVFVGRKYVPDIEKTISLEFKEIDKRHIKFYDLPAGKLTRLFSFKSLTNILKTPSGFFYACQLLKKEKPDVILTFGGYIGLPISIVGSILKIQVIIHEQTIHPGLANRIISGFATLIFISFPEARQYFPPKKTAVSGNPVKESVFKIIKKPFEIKKDKPVIYVTGGSLGSHSLNVIIEKILPSLLRKYIVIHQTGNIKEYDDYQRLSKTKANLGDLKNNYYLREHFYENEIGYIYSLADIVIGRSGANTFFETIALKKPAIFVPLPWSAANEQNEHAAIFEKYQTGFMFNQYWPEEELIPIIETMFKDLKKYKDNFKNLENKYRKDATEIIVQKILQLG
jgi:UDP-N-acetylglucosamine--N-acetylmuramyl-(pentapeptide) pyrophosphoryl-undecaprenol N-acetylglucosamine transferase